MYYINFNLGSSRTNETVDEFTTLKEARLMLREYLLVGGGNYWLSRRCCKGWK
jgi:hypothetical protein